MHMNINYWSGCPWDDPGLVQRQTQALPLFNTVEAQVAGEIGVQGRQKIGNGVGKQGSGGSCAGKAGAELLVCHKSRFVHHILCESPFISRDLYAIRPLVLWHILGTYFLLIWGVGVVRIIFDRPPIDDRNPIRKFSIDPLCLQN